ncbi:MAG: TlpA disulfide reductase family protein [Planctomycetaceae bacterium]
MLFCLLLMLQTNPTQQPALTATHFRGELQQRAADGFSPVDDFRVVRFTDRNNKCVGTVLLQSSPDRNPWQRAVSADGTPPIRYVHNAVPYQLAPVATSIAEQLTEGNEWKMGRAQFTVGKQSTFQNIKCFEVMVRQGAAREHRLMVEAKTGNVVSLRQRVFMGQGDEFRMTLERVLNQPQTNDTDIQFLNELLQVQSIATQAASSDASANEVQNALPDLKKQATSRWTKQLFNRIESETSGARNRTLKLAEMEKALLGKQLSIAGTTLDGKPFEPKSLAEKVVVLHIWQYRAEPLAEPYGQVAYLDFMKDKFKNQPVQVIGINVDSRFSDKTLTRTANRSARKLVEFMNLSYPVIGNDGSILKATGDPRAADAKLPLWIVLDKSQRVRLWKAGYFKVDARRGLQDLEKTIRELLK